jgi:hypothetical protein
MIMKNQLFKKTFKKLKYSEVLNLRPPEYKTRVLTLYNKKTNNQLDNNNVMYV